MVVHPLYRSFFLLFSLFVVSFCSGNDKIFEVVGTAKCADCNNNKWTSLAFLGLGVTVDCKLKNGDMKTFGAGKIDDQGKFKVQLSKEIVKDSQSGDFKEECYARLHSAATLPCPTNNGAEASKLELQSESEQKKTFVSTKNLLFTATLCSSKHLWHFFHHPHPWFNPHPMPINEPTQCPPPPPVPIDNPSPVVNPIPPTEPIYGSPPPPVPIYYPPPPPLTEPTYGSPPPPVPIYYPPPPPVYTPPL